MTFASDLKFGKVYETDCALRVGNGVRIIQGKFKPYDMIDDDGVKYEVKSDRRTVDTGNICIEYMCNGKESGITTTTADWYFYYVVDVKSGKPYERLYKIPTDEIRRMIEKTMFVKIFKGGDGWRSTFYLFREDTFQSFKVL